MWLGFVRLAPTGGNTSLRVLPAEQPQVFVRVAQISLAQSRFVSRLVPLISMVRIAGFEIDASKFVGDAGGAGKIGLRRARIEHLLLELRRLRCLPLESIRHRHGTQS